MKELYVRLCDMDLFNVRHKSSNVSSPCCVIAVASSCRWLSSTCEGWSRSKAQCISVAWKRAVVLVLDSVGFYIVKMCVTSWVLNLCLITVTNICCLNAVKECTTEPLSLQSQKKPTHLNQWGNFFTVYNNTSWCQNVTDVFDTPYEYWDFFPMELCIYAVVYTLVIFCFSLVEILAKIALPPSCLGISACVTMTTPLTPPSCLLTLTCLALSFFHSVSLSLSECCMVLTRPS